MATVNGTITINLRRILDVASDPAAGAGTAAPIGSLALLSSGGVGELWLKTAAADTSWSKVGAAAGPIRVVSGPDTLDPALDQTILLDSTGLGGIISLGAGVEGTIYNLSSVGAGVAVYNLIPGTGAFDVNVNTTITVGQVRNLRFFSGTWYNV